MNIPAGWVVVPLEVKEHTVDAAKVRERAQQGASRNDLVAEFNTTAAIIAEIVPFLRSINGAQHYKKPDWWTPPKARSPGVEMTEAEVRALCRHNLLRYEFVEKLRYLTIPMPEDTNRVKAATSLRREYIRKVYAAGIGTREIFCRTGCSPSQISRWTAGLPRRGRGRNKTYQKSDAIFNRIPPPKLHTASKVKVVARAHKNVKISDKTKETMRDMRGLGYSTRAIAEACQVSESYAKLILRAGHTTAPLDSDQDDR